MIRHISFASLTALSMALACNVGTPTEEEPGLHEIEGHGDEPGQDLFEKATFGGNGRTCATCHPSGKDKNGTLNSSEVQKRKLSDPLFRHDAADVIGGNTFNRIRAHATILVEMPLPANVAIAGSSARNVILARGIPTTMNTPSFDSIFQVDGRAPNLQEQARGAILGHAQSSNVTQDELDLIAEFQQTLFNRPNLKVFIQNGTPLSMPLGKTDAEKRGRRFFIADGLTDPELVGENPQAICGWCHSGNFLDEMSAFAATNIVPFPATEGHRFTPILVSALNAIGNPVISFEFTNPDGSVTPINSPDPGLALVTGNPAHNGFFKTPTCWGVKNTAPYFHDNSAKTLTDLMNHYDTALFIQSTNNPKKPPVIDLTEQQKADIIAYMMLL